jgi:hypothetical protein
MTRLRRSLAAALLCCILPAGLAVAQARARGPAEAYLAAAAAVRKAKDFGPILPHLSAQYRSDVESQDVEGRKAFFDYFKDSLAQTDLVILKETIEGEVATLEASGRDAAGRPAFGAIDMVKEDGAWRLDDYTWTPSE